MNSENNLEEILSNLLERVKLMEKSYNPYHNQ